MRIFSREDHAALEEEDRRQFEAKKRRAEAMRQDMYMEAEIERMLEQENQEEEAEPEREPVVQAILEAQSAYEQNLSENCP